MQYRATNRTQTALLVEVAPLVTNSYSEASLHRRGFNGDHPEASMKWKPGIMTFWMWSFHLYPRYSENLVFTLFPFLFLVSKTSILQLPYHYVTARMNKYVLFINMLSRIGNNTYWLHQYALDLNIIYTIYWTSYGFVRGVILWEYTQVSPFA